MQELQEHPVLEKNEKAAAMWSGGGADYDRISLGISSALDHAVARLAPTKGMKVLDIATGTGFTARLAARRGASVTGVDIAEGLLESARGKAKVEGLQIDWQLGDAERLPFDDNSFDGAISTFGIMFATDQEAALSELVRVVRPGGRIVVAAWTHDSNAVGLRKAVAPFMSAPPAGAPTPPSPFNWGDPDWLRTSLGQHVSLGIEEADTVHRLPDAQTVWEEYSRGFGPVRAVAQSLDETRLAEMRSAFLEWVEQFRTDLGIAMPFRYVVSAGIKTSS